MPRRRPGALHAQDFCEVFWLQNGRLKHLVNGSAEMLREGDVVFMRATDAHSLQALDPETRIVNILIHPDITRGIAARFPELRDAFFWSTGPLPARSRRDSRALAELSRLALRLETGPRSALRIEAFLLSLFAELGDADPGLPDSAPEWLRRACIAVERPEVFARGAAGLVAAAGRAHAHVSRVCRTHLGMTPSDYVNQVRMDYAARRLAGTTDSLEEIAEECGISTMSHFHRLFRSRHGMTPRAWRVRHQHEIVQPI